MELGVGTDQATSPSRATVLLRLAIEIGRPAVSRESQGALESTTSQPRLVSTSLTACDSTPGVINDFRLLPVTAVEYRATCRVRMPARRRSFSITRLRS